MEQVNELLESIGLTKKNALIIVGSVIAFWVMLGKSRTYVRRAATKYKTRRANRKASPIRKRASARMMNRQKTKKRYYAQRYNR